MKVLFVWPNKDVFGYRPYGLSLLIALCKQRGYVVDLFETTYISFGNTSSTEALEDISVFKPVDYSAHNIRKEIQDVRETFFEKLHAFKPDVIAYSALSDEFDIAVTLAQLAKEWDAEVINIFGGKHVTVCPEEAMEYACIDFICISEGLEAFPEFLDACRAHKDMYRVENIWGRRKNEIIKNPLRPLREDLDSLPFADWKLFDERNFFKPYDGTIVRGGDWMLNWGCVYSCHYCINKYLHDLHKDSPRIRRFSPQRAIDELKYLTTTHNLSFYKFIDEDFLLRPIEHMREFAELYKQEVFLPFAIETNAKSVTKEKVQLLKEMNCVSVSIGVESGNKRIREEVLNRKDSTEDIKEAVRVLNAAGIRTQCFLMLNVPFDTRESIFDSIELVRETKIRIPHAGIFYPFEKTRARLMAIENNLFTPGKDSLSYDSLWPALDQPTISREQIIALRRVFVLYAKLPKSYWPLIRRAEQDDDVGKEIYGILKKIFKKHVMEQGDYFTEELCLVD